MFGDKKKAQIETLRVQNAQLNMAYSQLHSQLEYLNSVVAQAGGQDLLQLQQAVVNARIMQQNELQQIQQNTQQRVFQAQQEAQQQVKMAYGDTLRQGEEAERRLKEVQASLEEIEKKQANIRADIENKKVELAEIDEVYKDATAFIEAGLADFAHPAKDSIDLGDELVSVREQIKKHIRNKTATSVNEHFTFNGSSAQGRRLVASISKIMLRSYNAEAENCILTVKAGNGLAAEKRLERAREQVRNLGKMMDLKITADYHRLRIRELRLALDYQNAKKAEKEEERERRAQLREEARAQKELEIEREKLKKEHDHYQNVLDRLLAQGKQDEASDIQAKISALDQEIESVDYRVANIRAGYVYVISNIGSFGDDMVKIGMTRRLNPLDRVRELSDASVPFNFDVHALFFSEDAVAVETELHHRFAAQRVNLINKRREFFRVTPAEVKKELADIAGNLLEFIDVPEAEQYRESLALRQQGGSEW